jgi:hypothetical protein
MGRFGPAPVLLEYAILLIREGDPRQHGPERRGNDTCRQKIFTTPYSQASLLCCRG